MQIRFLSSVSIGLLGATLLAPALSFAAGEFKVRATSLNVRDSDGDIICQIPDGTMITPVAREKTSTMVQVKVNTSTCKNKNKQNDDLFVDSDYLFPVGQTTIKAETTDPGVGIRSELEHGPQCWIPQGSKLELEPEPINGARTARFFKAKIVSTNGKTAGSCPTEGFVSASTVRSAGAFDSLPLYKDRPQGRTVTQACVNCELAKSRGNGTDNISEIRRESQNAPSGRNPFLEAIDDLKSTGHCRGSGFNCVVRGKKGKRLIQMPLLGNRGNIGACGSHHYSPNSKHPVSRMPMVAYASPATACAFTGFLQEWKKNYCQDGSGCRVQWGDISHRDQPYFGGHASHHSGDCIDIRPPRSGQFESTPIEWASRSYSRAKTQQMIALARRMGATTVLFNDPALNKSRDPSIHTNYCNGHHNHLHICFGDNPVTRSVCNNLKIDPQLCPELQ